MNHVDIVLIFVMCLPWLLGCSRISCKSVRDGTAPVINPPVSRALLSLGWLWYVYFPQGS